MSRYAAPREDEPRLYPGYFTGQFATHIVSEGMAEHFSDPEEARRGLVAHVRHNVLTEYNRRRAGSLETASWNWMKPPGRVRFRWVRRGRLCDTGAVSYLELTAVVYPEGALP